jgi:SAM-dependent methyltransferase
MELFPLGEIEVSPGAAAALAAARVEVDDYLARHQRGEWGEEDREWAEFGARYGHQINAGYPLPDGTVLLVMTAFDRSHTRVLLEPEIVDHEVSAREGYALWSKVYDAEKNPLIAIEEPRVDALVATLPLGRALDAGAGTGRHALKLARRGMDVTAFDQSPEMLAHARQAAEREGLRIEFRLGALEDALPFETDAFDLVVCALALLHVADFAPVVAEFFRVLKPGGHLLITDFHPDVVAEGWRTVFFVPGASYLLPNPGATRHDYLQAVRTAGFELARVEDVPIREVPEAYFPESMRREHGDKAFCLILFAMKPL